MNSFRAARAVLIAISLTAFLMSAAFASKTDKIEELVSLHDLKTSVAIGNHYLKQQALLAVRSQLAAMGAAQNLGPDWNPSNPHWKEAEAAMVQDVMKQVTRQFSSMEWLSEEWAQLDDRDFKESDIDTLLAHFKSSYGRKQAMIMDHSVAIQVQSALTFSGKMIYDVPGAQQERTTMQRTFDAEDQDMRFNMNESPEGVQFAMSPVGKRYFVNAVLKVSGMIIYRLDQTAASIPQMVKGFSAQAQPAVDAFRRQHEG